MSNFYSAWLERSKENDKKVNEAPRVAHHQHFNPFDRDMKELRFEFGVRYWLVDQWKGYTMVDKHSKATTHMID